MLDQPVNAQSFTEYVEQCLVPTLLPGDVVIMDICGRPRWSKLNLGIERLALAPDARLDIGLPLGFLRWIRLTRSIDFSHASLAWLR